MMLNAGIASTTSVSAGDGQDVDMANESYYRRGEIIECINFMLLYQIRPVHISCTHV